MASSSSAAVCRNWLQKSKCSQLSLSGDGECTGMVPYTKNHRIVVQASLPDAPAETTNENIRAVYVAEDNPHDRGCCANYVAFVRRPAGESLVLELDKDDRLTRADADDDDDDDESGLELV